MSTGGTTGVSLSVRLSALFDEVRDPHNGKHYTPRDVEAGVREQIAALPEDEQKHRAISHVYVWQLRRGHRINTTIGKIQSLAEFFGVQPSYFTDPELTETEVQYQALIAAGLRNDLLRQIVLLLVRTDEDTHRLVLALLHHITALQQQPPTARTPPA